jgi:beta-catenin-like protein 1
MYRKNARHVSYEELTGRSFDVPNGEGSSSSSSGPSRKKARTVSVQDEDDEDDDGEGSKSRYEGIANPEEEDEDDRFFGDGLTTDQKDILDYVDDIDLEEVIILHQHHRLTWVIRTTINSMNEEQN